MLAALTGLVLVTNRRKLFKRLLPWLAPVEWVSSLKELASRNDVQEASAATAEHIVSHLLPKVDKAVELHFDNTISKLRAEVIVLRKEREELRNGWQDIWVHVRGYRPNDESKGQQYMARVQINLSTSELRAHPESEYRRLVHRRDTWHFHHRYGEGKFERITLGAPWFLKIEGTSDSVILLDERYTVK
jgi:hypothetical protein